MPPFTCNRCGKCCASLGRHIHILRVVPHQGVYGRDEVSGEIFFARPAAPDDLRIHRPGEGGGAGADRPGDRTAGRGSGGGQAAVPGEADGSEAGSGGGRKCTSGDQRVERHVCSVCGSIASTRLGVSTHPQLGPGLARRIVAAQKLWKLDRGTPCVFFESRCRADTSPCYDCIQQSVHL